MIQIPYKANSQTREKFEPKKHLKALVGTGRNGGSSLSRSPRDEGFADVAFFGGCLPFPETNSSHLKMDGWKTSFLLRRPICRGELLVSGIGYSLDA